MSLLGTKIEAKALGKIRALVKSAQGNEIGGPMVGYVSDGILFIKDVDGPGAKGVCLPHRVTIDGESSQQFCDNAYRISHGEWDYVGDWHCHPGFSLDPSEDDSWAMQLMASTPGLVSNPVSLIYSRLRRSYRIYEWTNDQKSLRLIR